MSPHIQMFAVGEDHQWLGAGDNLYYRPYPVTDFNPMSTDSVIVARAAFASERPIVGPYRKMPPSRIGQLAILETPNENGSHYEVSVAVPYKIGRFTITTEAFVQKDLDSMIEVKDAIKDPASNLQQTVRQAIIETITSHHLTFNKRIGEY